MPSEAARPRAVELKQHGRRRHQDPRHRSRHHGAPWRTRRTSWACASRTTPASRRPTPGTTSNSAPPASSTGTAFPTPPSKAACRTFPPATTTTTRPTASATPAICGARPTRSGSTKVLDAMVQAHVAWDAHARYLRGQPRPAARPEPAVVRRLPAPDAGGVFPARTPPTTARTSSGWTSTDETYWKENYRLWMAALREFDRQRRPDRHGRRRRLHLPDVRLRPDPQHGTAPGGRLPSASRSSSRPPATTRGSWARRSSSGACAPASPRT